jgi:hypothetical protein
MGDASGRKDEGTLHIGGCAFLSVFLCWLIVTESQSIAKHSRSDLIASAMQWQVLAGTGL